MPTLRRYLGPGPEVLAAGGASRVPGRDALAARGVVRTRRTVRCPLWPFPVVDRVVQVLDPVLAARLAPGFVMPAVRAAGPAPEPKAAGAVPWRCCGRLRPP